MVDQLERTAERDPYVVLQVDPHADQDVVSAAFRALARRYHPDGSTPDPARMAELSAAYEHVKTPDARARFDRSAVREASRPSWPWTAGDGVSAADPAWRRPAATTPPWTIPPRRGASPTMDFGRYAGWTIDQIAGENPDYLRWLSRHSAGVRFHDAIVRVLGADLEIGQRATAVA